MKEKKFKITFFYFVLHMFVHLLVNLTTSYLTYRLFDSSLLAIICFLAGFVIDLDHLLDYFILAGLKFDWKDFIDAEQYKKTHKFYLIFHGWEIFPALLILALVLDQFPLMIAFGLGLFGHLVIDMILNKRPVLFYSLIYRLYKNFTFYETEK